MNTCCMYFQAALVCTLAERFHRRLTQFCLHSPIRPAFLIKEKSRGHCSVLVSSVIHGSFPHCEDAGNISRRDGKPASDSFTVQTASAPKTAPPNAKDWICELGKKKLDTIIYFTPEGKA